MQQQGGSVAARNKATDRQFRRVRQEQRNKESQMQKVHQVPPEVVNTTCSYLEL